LGSLQSGNSYVNIYPCERGLGTRIPQLFPSRFGDAFNVWIEDESPHEGIGWFVVKKACDQRNRDSDTERERREFIFKPLTGKTNLT